MGENSTHQTIIRHWTLLSKLPTSTPGITASELTTTLSDAGFEVTKRQIERDLKDLETFFALGCNDKGKPYGWYWPIENRRRFFLISLPGNEYQHLVHQLDPLYQQLSPRDFSLQIAQLRQCFVGRGWLFESVKQWLNESPSPILWLNGAAGLGKSSAAAFLIKRDGLKVVGHFFCRYQRGQAPESVARDFVLTLAAQLAEKFPIFRSNLLGRLASSPQLLCRNLSPQELFEHLVMQPLEQIGPVTERAIIVIDALDEAAEADGHHPLADLLALVADAMPRWLRFVVTSRPVFAVQQRLSRFDTLVLGADDERHLMDLRGYVEMQIASLVSEDKRSALIDEIMEKSAGSFLYAAALARVGTDELLKDKLLPANMDDFLRSNFERLFPDTEKYKRLQEPLLGIVVAFAGILPEALACQMLELSQREWTARLQPMLGSLLIKREQGYEPFHRCLIDWLSDPDRSGLYSVTPDGGQKIGTFLLKQMSSLQWPDLASQQRHFVLSHLPEFIKLTSCWQDAEQLMDVGTHLHKAYQYHSAASVIQRMLELVERQRPNATLMVRAMCQSAANSRCLGDLEEAFDVLHRARRIANELEPENNSLHIEICSQLGLTAYRAKDFASAGERFIEAKDLSGDEAEIAALLNYAGRMLMHVPQRRKEAEDILLQSLQIRNRLYGNKHPVCGATLNNLGFMCMLDDRLDEAESYFHSALTVKLSRNTGYDESVALAEANLGTVCLRLGKLVPAEQHLLNALAKRETLYGRYSIPVAKTLKKLCLVRLAQHRNEEALEDSKRAVECYEANLGRGHFSTIETMKLLAETQLRTGLKTLALETAQEVLSASAMQAENAKLLREEVEEIVREATGV